MKFQFVLAVIPLQLSSLCLATGAVASEASSANPDIADESSVIAPRLINNVRLRLEIAEDDALPNTATALTARFRSTLEFNPTANITLLGEIEAVGELIDDFNDGRENWTNGDVDRKQSPIIPDPEGIELNRIQAIVSLSDNHNAIIGRQRIVLDDERFIGISAFRQNDRTLDAVRFRSTLGNSVILDGGYIRRVRRVIRDDKGVGFFDGNSYFANINIPAPAGRAAIFHYAFDLSTGTDNTPNEQFSSTTTGVRLEGRRYWENIGLFWEGSYAYQEDYADNPNDYSAYYALGSLGVEVDQFTVDVRSEILSGNEDSAGFSTPLGTARRFQGIANVFFTTPRNGVKDHSIGANWNIGRIGRLTDARASLRYHQFGAEAIDQDYGTEFDAGFAVKYGRSTLDMSYARYWENGFASDRSHFTISVAHAF